MEILKKIKKKIWGITRRTGITDDFDWSRYNEDEYSKQIHDFEQQYTFVLPDGKYKIENGKIILDSGLLPLNENHQALYEAIYSLRPDSVLEVGFGCGDHLYNLKKLLPKVALGGVDLLPTQYEFLLQRHPELQHQANLWIADMTLPLTKNITADLVYTQAVLMHIQRYQPYLEALKNTFSLSKKYVVLMENWTRHNFFEDIRKISALPGFAWNKAYYYTYDAGKQVALVLSNTPLSGFEEITSNDALLKYYGT